MATNKQIRISITSALNAAGIEATKGQVDSMAKSVAKSMGDAAKANRTHWADIKAVWDMGLSAIRYVGGMIRDALKKAFDAEYALTSFKTMLGSLDAAKQHVAELKQFAAQTPLTFGDLSQASKTLLAFGADVKTVMPSLKMLGDLSLGNAEKMQSLSLAFGKVHSEGKLTGVTLKQMIVAGFNPLQEIADKTGASMDALKDQMEKGELSFNLVKAAMESATSEGGRFHNAMKEASQTGAGLFSTMEDNWNATVTKFGGAFVNAAKGGISKVIETLQQLNKDGTIDVWANKVAEACEKVVGAVRVAAEWGGKLVDAFKWVRDKGEQISSAVGTTVGYFMGGGYDYGEAMDMAKKAYADSGKEIEDRNKEAAEKEVKIRAEAAKKAAQEEALIKQKEREKGKSLDKVYEEERKNANKEKLLQDFDKYKASGSSLTFDDWRQEQEKKAEEALKKRKEEYAKFVKESQGKDIKAEDVNIYSADYTRWDTYEKKKAEEKEKAEKKVAEKSAAERARLDAQEAARRERERRAELAARIRDHQKLLAAERAEESKSRSAVSAAESKLQQAWGWYRDKDSMAAQIAEEKADAQARKQFEKDFERLKDRRRDWRTAENLSVDDEAVRRVALAREEKEQAERHLAEIEKNTASLAEKLDELLQVKGCCRVIYVFPDHGLVLTCVLQSCSNCLNVRRHAPPRRRLTRRQVRERRERSRQGLAQSVRDLRRQGEHDGRRPVGQGVEAAQRRRA